MFGAFTESFRSLLAQEERTESRPESEAGMNHEKDEASSATSASVESVNPWQQKYLAQLEETKGRQGAAGTGAGGEGERAFALFDPDGSTSRLEPRPNNKPAGNVSPAHGNGDEVEEPAAARDLDEQDSVTEDASGPEPDDGASRTIFQGSNEPDMVGGQPAPVTKTADVGNVNEVQKRVEELLSAFAELRTTMRGPTGKPDAVQPQALPAFSTSEALADEQNYEAGPRSEGEEVEALSERMEVEQAELVEEQGELGDGVVLQQHAEAREEEGPQRQELEEAELEREGGMEPQEERDGQQHGTASGDAHRESEGREQEATVDGAARSDALGQGEEEEEEMLFPVSKTRSEEGAWEPDPPSEFVSQRTLRPPPRRQSLSLGSAGESAGGGEAEAGAGAGAGSGGEGRAGSWGSGRREDGGRWGLEIQVAAPQEPSSAPAAHAPEQAPAAFLDQVARALREDTGRAGGLGVDVMERGLEGFMEVFDMMAGDGDGDGAITVEETLAALDAAELTEALRSAVAVLREGEAEQGRGGWKLDREAWQRIGKKALQVLPAEEARARSRGRSPGRARATSVRSRGSRGSRGSMVGSASEEFADAFTRLPSDRIFVGRGSSSQGIQRKASVESPDGKGMPRTPGASREGSTVLFRRMASVQTLKSIDEMEGLAWDIVQCLESRGLDPTEAFDLCDASSSAKLDLEGVRDLLKGIGVRADPGELARWFQRMVGIADGTITREQWGEAMRRAKHLADEHLAAMHRGIHEERGQFSKRTLRVMAMALYLRGLHTPDDRWRAFASEEDVLTRASILATCRAWQMDVSADDVGRLCVLLGSGVKGLHFGSEGESGEQEIDPEVFVEALPELREIASVVQGLSMVCSALLHDCLDIQDGFDEALMHGKEQGRQTLTPLDMHSLVDRWQLEMKREDVDELFAFMDSHQQGTVTRHSWQRAVGPVHDILTWGVHVIVDLTRERGMSIHQAYSLAMKSERQQQGMNKNQLSAVMKLLAPNWEWPTAMLRVLHLHMADLGNGQLISAEGWRRALEYAELLKSEQDAGSTLVLMPGTKWERPVRFLWMGILTPTAGSGEEVTVQLLLNSKLPEEYGLGMMSPVEVHGLGKRWGANQEALTAVGRVETNFAIQLTLTGSAWTFGSARTAKALKCEGSLQGRRMEGTWQCGAAGGLFVFHLLSSQVGELDRLQGADFLLQQTAKTYLKSSSFKLRPLPAGNFKYMNERDGKGPTELVQETWRLVEKDLRGHGIKFFLRVFEIAPPALGLFSFRDEKPLESSPGMARHAEDVMRTVGHAVSGLTDVKTLVPVLEALGGRHADYGVEAAHFDIVGQALLWTLEQGLGNLWTPEVRDAWTMTFTAVAKVMEPNVRKQGNNAKLDRIKLLRKSFWVQNCVRYEPSAVHVESEILRALDDLPAIVRHTNPISNLNPFFEVLLLDDISGEGSGCVSIGLVLGDCELDQFHVGCESGCVGFNAREGKVYVSSEFRNHEVFQTCTVGDVIGCGSHFGADGNVTCVFWTKNGAVIASVSFESFGGLMGVLFPAVSIEGQGMRVLVQSAAFPPLLQLAASIDTAPEENDAAPSYSKAGLGLASEAGGGTSVEEGGNPGAQMWCGVLCSQEEEEMSLLVSLVAFKQQQAPSAMSSFNSPEFGKLESVSERRHSLYGLDEKPSPVGKNVLPPLAGTGSRRKLHRASDRKVTQHVEVRGEAKGKDCTFTVSGRIEKGKVVKLSLRASGAEGAGIRAEGSVSGRGIRGSWVSGSMSGHFCLHLVSCDSMVLHDDAVERRSRSPLESPLSLGLVSPESPRERSSSSKKDARREWGESKIIWGDSKIEMDEEFACVEWGTVRSLRALPSIVQHRLPLSKDSPYFEVLLLEDPVESIDAKCKWSIGVAAHQRLKADTHVGWMEGSVGYHPRDGALYDGRSQRRHELYDTAGAGDVIGCGCLYVDSKDAKVRSIFFTKNGAVIGSVNVEGWETLSPLLVASVGLEGEGLRVAVMTSAMPPLVEGIVSGAANVQACVSRAAGTQVWVGMLDSFDDSGDEVVVHLLATANKVEGEEGQEIVEFELYGEGLRGRERLVASGSVGPHQDLQLLLWNHLADIVNPATITCSGRVQGRCMLGTWHQTKQSGRFRLHLISSDGAVIGEGTATRKKEVEDPVLELKGSDIPMEDIPQLSRDMWSESNLNRVDDSLYVDGAVVKIKNDKVAMVQHVEPLSERRNYFEVMLLDDLGKEDFLLSIGVTPIDCPLVGSHVGWDEGSIGFRFSDGTLSFQSKVPARTKTREQRKIVVGDSVGCGCLFSQGEYGRRNLSTIFWTRNGTVVCSLDLSAYQNFSHRLFASVAIEGAAGGRFVMSFAVPPPMLSLVLAGCYDSADDQVTQASVIAAMAECCAENTTKWLLTSRQEEPFLQRMSIAEYLGDFQSDMQLAADREFRNTAALLVELLPDSLSGDGYTYFDRDKDGKMSLQDLQIIVEERAPNRFLSDHLKNFHQRLARPHGGKYVDRRLWGCTLRMVMARELPLALWRDQERSAKFMCSLLASCEMSIEDGFEIFSQNTKTILHLQFVQTFRSAFADWVDFSDYQLATLFAQFTRSGAITKAQWNHFLVPAAEFPGLAAYRDLLLRPASVVVQRDSEKFLTSGERQRLRSIFYEAVGRKDLSATIHREKLTQALAKMGISQNVDSEGRSRQGWARGQGGKKSSGVEPGRRKSVQAPDLVSYMELEKAVEQSRLETTLEQSGLHRLIAQELMKHKPKVTTWARQRAIQQVQSPHLFSWLTDLGGSRLDEIMLRVLHDAQERMKSEMKDRIVNLKVSDESVSDLNSNSKYATWAGTFDGKTVQGSFGKLDQFKQGLDSYIGFPSPNVETAIRIEHTQSSDSTAEFVAPNNKDLVTTPAKEYWLVLSDLKAYPGNRRGGAVHSFLKHPRAKRAGLTLVEVIALRLYTGPMYVKYNAVLRNIGTKKVNHYVTTIHAIVSGIIKLSAVWVLPPSRKVYRGLNGVELPREFWEKDEFGCKGGVEYGLMSTTTDISVAIQYSSGRVPTIFEINVGQVDRGAELNWISQYWHENEVLIPPLSNLEVVGNPHLRTVEIAGQREMQVLVVPLKVNVNIKSKSLEELVATRKTVFQTALRDLQSELKQEIVDMAQAMGEAEVLTRGQGEETEWFNDHLSLAELGKSSTAVPLAAQVPVNRRRKDLNELIEERVNNPDAKFTHAIISLEHRLWAEKFNILHDMSVEMEIERFQGLLLERAETLADLREFLGRNWDAKGPTRTSREGIRDILDALEKESSNPDAVAQTDGSYWKGASELLQDTLSWWSGDGGLVRQATLNPAHFLLSGKSHANPERHGSWGDEPSPVQVSATRAVPRDVKRLVTGIALQMVIMHPGMDAGEVYDKYSVAVTESDQKLLKGADLHGWIIAGVLQTLPLFYELGDMWVANLGPCLYSLALDMSWSANVPTRTAWVALMQTASATDTIRNMKAIKEKLLPDNWDRAGSRGTGSARSLRSQSEGLQPTSSDAPVVSSLALRRLQAFERLYDLAREKLHLESVVGDEHASLGGTNQRRSGSARDLKGQVTGSPSRVQGESERAFGSMDATAEDDRSYDALLEVWGVEGLWNLLLSLIRKCLREVREDESTSPTSLGMPLSHYFSHKRTSVDHSDNQMLHGPGSEDFVRMINELQHEAECLIDAKRRLEEMYSHWTAEKRLLRMLRASRKERSMQLQAHAFSRLQQRIQDGYTALFSSEKAWLLGGSGVLRWAKHADGRARFAPKYMPSVSETKGLEDTNQGRNSTSQETKELLDYTLLDEECHDVCQLMADLREIAREAEGVLDAVAQDWLFQSALSNSGGERPALQQEDDDLNQSSTNDAESWLWRSKRLPNPGSSSSVLHPRTVSADSSRKALVNHPARQSSSPERRKNYRRHSSVTLVGVLSRRSESESFTNGKGRLRSSGNSEASDDEGVAATQPQTPVVKETGGSEEAEKLQDVLESLSDSLERSLQIVHLRAVQLFESEYHWLDAIGAFGGETRPEAKAKFLQGQEEKLVTAHRLGGIAAKEAQAVARHEELERVLRSADTKVAWDSWVMCRRNMLGELWMIDGDQMNAAGKLHSERVLSWMARGSVGGELRRMLQSTPDSTLSRAACERRFNSAILCLETASRMLPLSDGGDSIGTEDKFLDIQSSISRFPGKFVYDRTVDLRNDTVLCKRLDTEEMERRLSRLEMRWQIFGPAQRAKGMGGELDWPSEKPSVEYLRAEGHYWKARIELLYRSQGQTLKRRSVKRCLELMDDTGLQWDNEGALKEVVQPWANFQIDDVCDLWEARMLGMLCLRAEVMHSSDQDPLPIEEMASGERSYLRLRSPLEHKTACFLAFFVATCAPNDVKVEVIDAAGTQTQVVILRPDGGAGSDITQGEDGRSILSLPKQMVSLDTLRLLLEAARADHSILHATVAGLNEVLEPSALQALPSGPVVESAALADMREQLRTADEIRLEENPGLSRGADQGREAMILICNLVLSVAPRLRVLVLCSNAISDTGMRELAAFLGLGAAPCLTELHLKDNRIGEQGALSLADALSPGPPIQVLVLEKNNLGFAGASHLSRALARVQCLHSLNIASNDVTSVGAIAIGAGMARCSTLTELNLNDNRVGDFGVTELAERLVAPGGKQMHALAQVHALRLSKNNITASGAGNLIKVFAIDAAQSLSVLTLTSNMISPDGMEEMTGNMQLAIDKTLQTLCVEKQRVVDTDIDPWDLGARRLAVLLPDRKGKVDSFRASVIQLRNDLLRENALEDAPAFAERLREMQDVMEKLESAARDAVAAQDPTTASFSGELQALSAKNYKQHRLARLRAVSKLKRAWLQAGRQLNQLNRESLDMDIAKTVRGFLVFAATKTDEPAERYLEDKHYIDALRESIDMKQQIKEQFRQRLMDTVMLPLADGQNFVDSRQLCEAEERVQYLANLVRLDQLLKDADRAMLRQRHLLSEQRPVYTHQAVKAALHGVPKAVFSTLDGDDIAACNSMEELRHQPTDEWRQKVEALPWHSEMLRRPWAFNSKLRELWSPPIGPERQTGSSVSRIGMLYHTEGGRYWQEVWSVATEVQSIVQSLQRSQPESVSERYRWSNVIDPRLRALIEEFAEILVSASALLEEQMSRKEELGNASWSVSWEDEVENLVEVCMATLSSMRRLRTTWSFARDLTLSTLALNEGTIAEAFRLCGSLEELFDPTGRGLIKDTFKAHEASTGEEYWWFELAHLSNSVVRAVRCTNMDPIRKSELTKLVESSRSFLREQGSLWERPLQGTLEAAERRLTEGAAELQSVVRRQCREIKHKANMRRELSSRSDMAARLVHTVPGVRLPLRVAVQVGVSVVGRRVRLSAGALEERGWHASVGEGVVVDLTRMNLESRIRVELRDGEADWLLACDAKDVESEVHREGLRAALDKELTELRGLYETGGAVFKEKELDGSLAFLRHAMRTERAVCETSLVAPTEMWKWLASAIAKPSRQHELATEALPEENAEGKTEESDVDMMEAAFKLLLPEEQKDFLQFVTHRGAISQVKTMNAESPSKDKIAMPGRKLSVEDMWEWRSPSDGDLELNVDKPSTFEAKSTIPMWDLSAIKRGADLGDGRVFTASQQGTTLSYLTGPTDLLSLFCGRNWRGVAANSRTYEARFRFKQIKTWVGLGALQSGKCLDGFAPWECGYRGLGHMMLCKGTSASSNLNALSSGTSSNLRSLGGPVVDTFLQSVKSGDITQLKVAVGDEVRIEVDPSDGVMTMFLNDVEIFSADGNPNKPFLPVLTACNPGVVVEILPPRQGKVSTGMERHEVAVDVLLGLEELCNETERRDEEYRGGCAALNEAFHDLTRISIEEMAKECLQWLPASLLAQPQCCRRLRAAICCLTQACRALPLLPLRDSDNALDFLVPPLEREEGIHSVMRCMELLQKGTACPRRITQAQRPRPQFDRAKSKLGYGSWLDGRSCSRVMVRTEPNEPPGLLVGSELLVVGRCEIEFDVEQFDHLVVGVGDEGILHDKWDGATYVGRGQLCMMGKQVSLDTPGFDVHDGGEELFWRDGDRVRLELSLGTELSEEGHVRFIRTGPSQNGGAARKLLAEGPCAGRALPFVRLGNGRVVFTALHSEMQGDLHGGKRGGRQSRRRSSGNISLALVSMGGNMDSQGELPLATATTPCALDVEDAWEARVFASMCVSPNQVEDFKVRQLATGELTSLTLRASDNFRREAAFVAHFVARACRNHVTVSVVGELGRTEVILSAGGGLGPYEMKEVVRHREEGSGEERGLVLALAGLGLQEEALVVLMEGALAARQDAVLAQQGVASVGEASEGLKSEGKGKVLMAREQKWKARRKASTGEQGSMTGSGRGAGMLGSALGSLKAVQKPHSTKGEDVGSAEEAKLEIHGLEINGNPLLGRGGRDAMILVVQLGMLTAGDGLLRLHMDGNGVTDDGVDALASSLEAGFAPHLQVLWLNDNEITDRGAARLAETVRECMDEVQELYLYRNPIGGRGKQQLRAAFRNKTAKVLLTQADRNTKTPAQGAAAATSSTKPVPWRLRL